MIEVNEQIQVPSAPADVWSVMSNPHAVVDCVPGASLGAEQDDGTFDATLTVKFGPAKVTFEARVALELDDAARTGNVSARGKDKQGGTRVRAAMKFAVLDGAHGQGSTVPIESRVEITGKLASLVESGAKFVVKRMTAEFSERLAARCAGEPIQRATDIVKGEEA